MFYAYTFDYVFHYAALVGVKRTLQNPVKVLEDINGDGGDDLAVLQLLFPQRVLIYEDPLAHSGGSAYPDSDHAISLAGEVTSAGDHDGDGYGDVAVFMGGTSTQDIDIYQGSSAGLAASSSATIVIDGYYSVPMRGEGDFDADGLDDLLVGPYLVLGPISGTLDAESDAHGIFVMDDQYWAEESNGLADLNGDGHADVVMGSYSDQASSYFTGSLWVVPGQ